MNRYYFSLYVVSVIVSGVFIYLAISHRMDLGVGSYATERALVRRYEIMSVAFLIMSIGFFLLSCPSDREK
jgi:hypothetical protein